MSYVRFTLLTIDADSKRKLGLLVAAHNLRDGDELSSSDHEYIRNLLGWFNMHLKIPKILKNAENVRAISWFKPDAQRPIEKMWELKSFMERYNRTVIVHKTQDPGIVLYEDGWQIVAKPRKKQKVS